MRLIFEPRAYITRGCWQVFGHRERAGVPDKSSRLSCILSRAEPSTTRSRCISSTCLRRLDCALGRRKERWGRGREVSRTELISEHELTTVLAGPAPPRHSPGGLSPLAASTARLEQLQLQALQGSNICSTWRADTTQASQSPAPSVDFLRLAPELFPTNIHSQALPSSKLTCE